MFEININKPLILTSLVASRKSENAILVRRNISLITCKELFTKFTFSFVLIISLNKQKEN